MRPLILITPLFLVVFLNAQSPSLLEEPQATTPEITAAGNMVYPYDQAVVTAFASPFYPAVIQLEAAERVRNILVGDVTMWGITTTQSGAQDLSTSYVIAKPIDFNLSTSLVITTDKRLYQIKLVSLESLTWSPVISFRYSAFDNLSLDSFESTENLQNLEATEENSEEQTKADTIPTADAVQVVLDNLNFNYNIDGRFSWTPLRVYDDNQKTYIQMPEAIKTIDAPVLLVIDAGVELVTNYRLIKKGQPPNTSTYYVVDRLFKRAILIKGVGLAQQRVTVWQE